MDIHTKIMGFFPEVGEIQEIMPLTSGLINQTYWVKTKHLSEPDYVLQRINHQIFTDVDMLQRNIDLVTSHIRKKLEERGEADIDRKVLRFLPSASGKSYHYDEETGYWRVSVFIKDSKTMSEVTPESSYLVGLKFGEFEAMLADLSQLTLIFKSLSNFAFMLMLVSGVLFMYYRTNMRCLLDKIIPYGKMSLTNYIMQSIVGSFLFYNWGLSLHDDLTITASCIVGVLLFFLQLAFCKWWIKHHTHGPLEYLWKRATWLK